MALQDSTKGRNTQRRRRFHNTPLNLPEIDFQMPNIPVEFFLHSLGMLQKMQSNTQLTLKVHVMISISLKTMLHVDYSYKL